MKLNRERIHIYYTMVISAISVLLNCFINLYLTPKITNSVGADAYGFVSLAKNFVSYANIIMTALNSYAARYMTMAYIQKDEEKFKQYYNTVFWGDCLIGGVIFIFGIVSSMFLEKILNIPIHLIIDVKLMFVLTFLTFYITTISTVFLASGYVKDRLDLINSIKGISYIVEIVILFFTYFILQPKVWYVGLALLIAAIVVFLGSVIITNKLLPGNNLQVSKVNKNAFKTLVVNGIWNSANSMGNALNSGLDLLVSNLLLDALSMGQVSIAKTINNMLYTIYATISQPFQPTFLKHYSSENNEKLMKELKYSMKVCGFITNLIFAGFVVIGLDFYNLWIPTQNVKLVYKLTVIAMLPCITEGCLYPIYYIYTLTVKNKIPCFITIIGGIFNILGMVILLKYTKLGVYAIVITTAVIMNIINFVANPLYMSKCLKVKLNTFYPEILINIFSCVFAIMSMKCVIYLIPKGIIGWTALFIKAVICVSIGMLAQILIIFRPTEIKKIILNIIEHIR